MLIKNNNLKKRVEKVKEIFLEKNNKEAANDLSTADDVNKGKVSVVIPLKQTWNDGIRKIKLQLFLRIRKRLFGESLWRIPKELESIFYS